MAATINKFRYELKLFISTKFITANITDLNHRRLVAQASTVEHAVKRAFDLGRSADVKAGEVVGEVLAKRVMVERLHDEHYRDMGLGIYANLGKVINEKKGVGDVSDNSNIVWAVVNVLISHGIKVIVV